MAVAATLQAPRTATAPIPSGSFTGSGHLALHLERGAIARHQLVAVARDIEVDGEALADVAALQGSVLVTGHVKGDVIVIGGNAHLGPQAAVDGDISVMG